MKKQVIVIGAGLAGSEASYQLAKRGFNPLGGTVHEREQRRRE